MKCIKKFFSILSFLVLICAFSISVTAKDYKYNETKKIESIDISEIELYPGGVPFGVKIQTKGLYVVKFDDNNSPAKSAGIKLGDIIVRVNNKDVETIEDFSKEVNNAKTGIKITVKRNDTTVDYNVKPIYSKDDGKLKVGVWVKDATSGIGTITFINPYDNTFGGLGHGICDGNTGCVIEMSKGLVYDARIKGVNKGKIGSAGELKGVFDTKKIGALTKNSQCGVYGLLTEKIVTPESKMKICQKNQVKEGDAYIWCTLDECGAQKYSVQICSIDYSNSGLKNFKVKITDPALLNKSGGIVQGMSGSPIIQNGKLVGAVTHVMINDPTTGYGIFIENMLKSSK